MQPQRIALLVVMILSVVELLSSLRRPRGVNRTRLRILVRAKEHPQLTEGLVRYLLWELQFWRGLDVEMSLKLDASCASCDEIQAVHAILLEEGLVGPAHDLLPDLVFIV